MQVSVEEAREKLPELITLVERGELITITRDEIPAPGVYSKGDFIRMWETQGWGRCQRQNGMHLLNDSTETSAHCGTNQTQNLLQMRCGTI